MKISCLALDAALEALIDANVQLKADIRRLRSVAVVDFSDVIRQSEQGILVNEAAYNELLNFRITEHGVPE